MHYWPRYPLPCVMWVLASSMCFMCHVSLMCVMCQCVSFVMWVAALSCCDWACRPYTWPRFAQVWSLPHSPPIFDHWCSLFLLSIHASICKIYLLLLSVLCTCIWVYTCAHAYGSIRVLPIQATRCVKSTQIYFFLQAYGLHYTMTSSRSVPRHVTRPQREKIVVLFPSQILHCNPLQHAATHCCHSSTIIALSQS